MKRILVYGLAMLLPILIIVYFYSFYQNQSPFTIKCMFHDVTGLWCPGCGGQRAFTLLVHGHLLKSLQYNILLPFALFLCGYVYYILIESWILGNKKVGSKLSIPPKFATYFMIFLLVYSILRNIPASPFIYLTPEY